MAQCHDLVEDILLAFDYDAAFSRNLGVVSPDEHLRLRNATVAIAGMGGVGGDYLISQIGRAHV